MVQSYEDKDMKEVKGGDMPALKIRGLAWET
jgi:hypothetical protein